MFIVDEAKVASRVGGVERGVLDFGNLFGESDEQEFKRSLELEAWQSSMKRSAEENSEGE